MLVTWTCNQCGRTEEREEAMPMRQCPTCASAMVHVVSMRQAPEPAVPSAPEAAAGAAAAANGIVALAFDPTFRVRLTRAHAQTIYWMIAVLMGLTVLMTLTSVDSLMRYGGGGAGLILLVTSVATAFAGILGARVVLEGVLRSNEAVDLLRELRQR